MDSKQKPDETARLRITLPERLSRALTHESVNAETTVSEVIRQRLERSYETEQAERDRLAARVEALASTMDVEFATIQQILSKLVRAVEALTHEIDHPKPVAEPEPELRIVPYDEIYAESTPLPAGEAAPESAPQPTRSRWWPLGR